MKRTVVYEIPKNEFMGLIEHLRAEGTYDAHSYFGMGFGTIDDKSTKDHGVNRRQFSEFRDSEATHGEMNLTVHDSALIKTIDAYFESTN